MRRIVLAVALAALVALAGCGGGAGSPTETGPGDATPTDTPDMNTPTPTATPTPEPGSNFDYPSGTSEDGIANASALAGAQREVLNGTSHTVGYETTVDRGDSTSTSYFDGRAGDSGSLFKITTQSGEGNSTNSIWVSGDGGVSVKQSTMGQESFSYFGPDAGRFADLYRTYDQFVATAITQQYAAAFHYEVADSYTEGGNSYVVYQSTGVNASYAEQSGTNFTEGDIRMTVRADGLVTAIEGTSTVDQDGTSVERELSYSVSGMGDTSVSEPAWTGDVPRVSATTVADGKVIKVTHEGGPAIGQSSLRLQAGSSFGQGTLEGLEPGESVYLTATSGDSYSVEVSVSTTMPSVTDENLDFTNADRAMVSIQSEAATIQVSAYVNESAGSMGPVVLRAA